MARHVSHHTCGLSVSGITIVLLAGLVGCGQSGSAAMLPAEGQVKFKGKLLTKGTVVLYPDSSKGNTSKHEPRAVIEADGRFKVVTHPQEGAPPGWYKVAVIVTEPSDPKNPYSLPRSLIPEKFGKPDESGLAFEVRSHAPPGAFDLDLD
jgi:hypothetical protein